MELDGRVVEVGMVASKNSKFKIQLKVQVQMI